MQHPVFPCAAMLGVTLSIAGCGEMVFKRGADPGAMAATQAECRAASGVEAAYLACMEREGFLVKGSQDSVFVDGVLPQPGAGAVTSETPAGGSPDAATPAAQVVTSSASAPAPASLAVAAPPPSNDPLERVAVGSWWKMGGTAEQLADAQAKCVETLGSGHRPAPEGIEVTRAMVDCLRGAGWRGFGN